MRMVNSNFPYPTHFNAIAFSSEMSVFTYSRFTRCHNIKVHIVNNLLHANHSILLIKVCNILKYLQFSLSALILLSINVIAQGCTVMKKIVMVVVVVIAAAVAVTAMFIKVRVKVKLSL
jgi:hypothetical protein